MPYKSNLLSRITPGEIGRDQAVVNYYYYDPSTYVEEAFKLGFFDGAGKELQRYSNISLFMKSGTIPSAAPKRYGCTISDIRPYDVNIPEHLKVSVCPDQHTSMIINTGTGVEGHAYISFFIKYSGLIRWEASGGAIDNINIGNVLSYPLTISDICIGHRTGVTGTDVRNVFVTTSVLTATTLQFIWFPAPAPLPVYPPVGENCQAYINITGVSSEYPNPP